MTIGHVYKKSDVPRCHIRTFYKIIGRKDGLPHLLLYSPKPKPGNAAAPTPTNGYANSENSLV